MPHHRRYAPSARSRTPPGCSASGRSRTNLVAIAPVVRHGGSVRLILEGSWYCPRHLSGSQHVHPHHRYLAPPGFRSHHTRRSYGVLHRIRSGAYPPPGLVTWIRSSASLYSYVMLPPVRMGQLPARGGGNLTGTVFLFLLIPFIPGCAGRGWGGGSGFSFLFFWFLLFLLCSFLFRPGFL